MGPYECDRAAAHQQRPGLVQRTIVCCSPPSSSSVASALGRRFVAALNAPSLCSCALCLDLPPAQPRGSAPAMSCCRAPCRTIGSGEASIELSHWHADQLSTVEAVVLSSRAGGSSQSRTCRIARGSSRTGTRSCGSQLPLAVPMLQTRALHSWTAVAPP